MGDRQRFTMLAHVIWLTSPKTSVGPVEIQGCQWYSSCRAWRPENHKNQWYKFQSKFESEDRNLTSQLENSWTEKREFFFFLSSFIYLLIYLKYGCFTLLDQFLHSVKWIRHVCACSVAQSSTTLCESMDCSLPDSSVNGIFQVIILEWVSISYSRESSQSRD